MICWQLWPCSCVTAIINLHLSPPNACSEKLPWQACWPSRYKKRPSPANVHHGKVCDRQHCPAPPDANRKSLKLPPAPAHHASEQLSKKRSLPLKDKNWHQSLPRSSHPAELSADLLTAANIKPSDLQDGLPMEGLLSHLPHLGSASQAEGGASRPVLRQDQLQVLHDVDSPVFLHHVHWEDGTPLDADELRENGGRR